MIFVVFDRRC